VKVSRGETKKREEGSRKGTKGRRESTPYKRVMEKEKKERRKRE